jgi:hypothetical protein
MVLQLKKKANAASARITRNGNNTVHVPERVIVVGADQIRPPTLQNAATQLAEVIAKVSLHTLFIICTK